MSTVMSTADPLPLVIPYQPMRVTVADYHAFIADGKLTKNHRIELLKGVMVEKMTHNPLHAGVILALQTLLLPLLPVGYLFRCQLPITLADSEPEPDVSVARGERADFWKRHPGPGEVSLVIEVASSSLVTDRFKGEIYSGAAIPVYWIVNLVKRRVEVYSNPTITADGPRYVECREFQLGDSIPVMLDGQEVGAIPASELLPDGVT
jgi:Uma2 family endonuclease